MLQPLITFLVSRTFRCLAYGVGASGILAGSAVLITQAGAEGPSRVISQQGKAFFPAAITIAKGESLVFKNDDVNVVHHAYAEGEKFSFDTGDQIPGTSTRIAFPEVGRVLVYCGIHPKMLLKVEVK